MDLFGSIRHVTGGTRLALLFGALVLSIALTACSSSSPPTASPTSVSSSPTPAPVPATATPTPAPTQIGVTKDSALGDILAGPNGHTLYAYGNDSPGTSNCTGTCADNWPPLATTGGAAGTSSITGLLSTITRSDGTKQASVNGMPLYYFKGDTAAGQTNGQGKLNGLWSAVKPNGDPVAPIQATSTPMASSTPTATATSTPIAASTTTASSTAPQLTVANDPMYGKILVGTGGHTVYLFEHDAAGTSTCTSGACAANWPPVLSTGSLKVSSQITGAIGSITRPDGAMQVTINGMPLYYFKGDAAAGQAHGEGLLNGAWWVVGPNGDPVKTQQAMATSTASAAFTPTASAMSTSTSGSGY